MLSLSAWIRRENDKVYYIKPKRSLIQTMHYIILERERGGGGGRERRERDDLFNFR